MKPIWTDSTAPKRAAGNQRTAERRSVAVPARLTWKDQRGTTRFASVVTRNVSDFGVYVECQSPISIPVYPSSRAKRNASSKCQSWKVSLQMAKRMAVAQR